MEKGLLKKICRAMINEYLLLSFALSKVKMDHELLQR